MKVELKEFLLKNPYEKNFPIVRKEWFMNCVLQ